MICSADAKASSTDKDDRRERILHGLLRHLRSLYSNGSNEEGQLSASIFPTWLVCSHFMALAQHLKEFACGNIIYWGRGTGSEALKDEHPADFIIIIISHLEVIFLWPATTYNLAPLVNPTLTCTKFPRSFDDNNSRFTGTYLQKFRQKRGYKGNKNRSGKEHQEQHHFWNTNTLSR